jgi:hypothetical protein
LVFAKGKLADAGGAAIVRALRLRTGPRFYLTYLGPEETVEAARARDAELRGSFNQQNLRIETGWLPEPPAKGQKGGGGGGGVETIINIGILVGAGAAAMFVNGFVGAIGADAWTATKRLVMLFRDRLRDRSNALTIRLVIQLRSGQQVWATLPVDDLSTALNSLDYIQLPRLPWNRFLWPLQWNSADKQWTLRLESPLPDADYVPERGIKG